MKALTLVRLYGVVAMALVACWCINLYEALAQPALDWRDAAEAPLLVMIFLTLILLVQARAKLTAVPTAAVEKRTGRYLVAGLAAAGLVAAVLIGFRAHG